eukprot:TRINITY_DN2804_c0_g1_i1.p1 TRINITY_DN2804_c0_g1~~TRINITY_DN2804_c0_g1_i1.p1  ORF type:complete len:118 (-),score=4.47 TRINITY_DN2804_c0_g1_i1:905-1258(-)
MTSQSPAVGIAVENLPTTWEVGICAGCSSDCWTACCCPCVVYSRIVEEAAPEMDWSVCEKRCMWCCCAGCCCCAATTMNVRAGLRDRYGIPGDEYNDWMAACCCSPCTLLQVCLMHQ